MQDIVAIALASMHQDMSRLDRVAQNLANATTPGYRREVVAPRAFADVVEAARATSATTPAVEIRADPRPGPVRVTGGPLDLALAGDAFFEVQTEAGPAYTRRGDFRVDGRGRLVTAAGQPVMGQGGEILLGSPSPVVDAEGRITEPGTAQGVGSPPGAPVAQLKLVRFGDPGRLQRLGDGLVTATDLPLAVEPGSVQVRQGALETSNVRTSEEMVQLIRTMRHFESMQKVVQGSDELLGMAIRKLGDLT